ncbi:MAG: hypothetical protein V1904_08485 [Bacteroidota bacterium]
MKKISFIVFVFLFSAFHTGDFVLLSTIPGSYSFMTTDNLGNVYTVSGCEFKKFSSDGVLIKSFSDKSHGDIAFADASDPLKILLFYHDFRQIIFLDNTLSINGDVIDLDKLELLQPLLACSSYENGFWVYDQQDFQLIRFDKNLQRSNSSGNITQLTGVDIKPNYLIETNNMVYLNNPETGILVFDKYGTYSKTLPIKQLNSFQIIGDNLVYASELQLIEYNFKTFVQKSSTLPVKKVLDCDFANDKIFIRDSSGISVYSVVK